MKIKSISRNAGSVLMATFGTAFVIGLGLASYMTLVSTQNTSVQRSQQWNAAIVVAEAGIEEAFSHLNVDAGNPTANGWTSQVVNGKTNYTKRRDFSSDGSYCLVTISNVSAAPVIFSQAVVPAPFKKGNLSRTVRVTTTLTGQSSGGTAAVGILTKNAFNLGSDFLIDSYDSTDPTKSTNGKYDAAKQQANGSLASMSSLAGQITLADSKIYGHMYTTATGSYAALGSHGSVGDVAWVSNVANESKVQPGAFSNDLNTTIPDVVPPAYQLWSTVTSANQTVGGVTYAYVLGSGNFQLPAGTVLKGKILVQGDASLYIPQDGRIQFGSGDVIKIDASLGASLNMYNASSTDVVMKDCSNDSGIPSRFTYYGLPTTAGSKITLTGSGAYAYAGVIYAPNQKLVLTGSSSGNEDFVGAITVDNFTMSGHTYMHIDESLLRAQIGSGGGGMPVINSYAEVASASF